MTLFSLLREGCTIIFPSGYILQRDPATNYIDTRFELDGTCVGDGLRELTKEGSRKALEDARKYEQKQKEHE
jgi:hypothetical protein